MYKVEWVFMKKKLFTSCILIMGIILISGCFDKEKNNLTTSNDSKSSGTLLKPNGLSYNNSYEELLRLSERVSVYSGTQKKIDILPGEIPVDLPVIIHIPDDAIILGSLISTEDKYKQLNVFLDVPKEPHEIFDFYRNSLNNTEWKELEPIFLFERGFVHFSDDSIPPPPIPVPPEIIFCQNNKGPFLRVIAISSNEEKLTDVRLYYDANPSNSPCWLRSIEINNAMEIMPKLISPKSAQFNGGRNNCWTSEDTFETELDLIELEAHYQNQLQEAGWKLKEKGHQDSIAMSTWSFTDEFDDQWSGLFLLNEVGQGDQKIVYFTVFRIY